jgi:hypothetical protein
MIETINELRSRRTNGLIQPLLRGTLPVEKLTNKVDIIKGWKVLWVSALIFFISLSIIFSWLEVPGSIDVALNLGIEAGIVTAAIYYVLPIIYVISFIIWNRQRPTLNHFAQFSNGQMFICLFILSLLLFSIFNYAFPIILYPFQTHDPETSFKITPFVNIWWHISVICTIMALLIKKALPFFLPEKTNIKSRKKIKKEKLLTDDTPYGIYLGRSTGALAKLWHKSAIASDYDVTLSSEDASQNILILGGIGAGKTTRIMQPILAQLLDQKMGGLIFDIKGDVRNVTSKLAEQTKHNISLIGPNHCSMNLLESLTPEIAASFLKSAFLLNNGSNIDSFWVDTATELCRNSLGLLTFIPQYYSLNGLYSYLFDSEMRGKINDELNPLLIMPDSQEKRLLKSYLSYHETIFSNFDEKVKSGVNATIAQVLAPFNHPELVDSFCVQSKKRVNMESILDGSIYLIDMPLSKWGLGGKVAYMFIKLRFFNVMQNRSQHSEWNQNNPVFFMCDEYQEIVSANKDGLSDLNFWDKSRSSKTIGIISAQSVSSFYAALGNRDLSHALLQNFRQKLCFRTEDQATLDMMDKLVGKAKIQRKTSSKNTGFSKNVSNLFKTKNTSDSQSITEVKESILDSSLFRDLSLNQVVALLSIKGESMDDILKLLPLFVTE